MSNSFIRVSGNTRVDLCRNGMWITDDKNIPGFYYKFQDRIPFHAFCGFFLIRIREKSCTGSSGTLKVPCTTV